MRRMSWLSVFFLPLTAMAVKYGPDINRKCPRCGEQFRERQIMSGNTVGAVYWTDGKVEAPMLPAQRLLVKCSKCKELVWVPDAEKVAEVKDPRLRVASPSAVSANDLLAAAAVSSHDPDKERYLRTMAWWSRNDQVRVGNAVGKVWTTAQRENVLRLIELLDGTLSENRLTRAEIYRELGDFVSALRELNEPFPKEYSAFAEKLRKLIEMKKREVEVLR